MLRRVTLLALFATALGMVLPSTGQQRMGQQPMQLPGQPPRGDNPADANAPNTKKPKEHESSSKDVQEKLEKALDNKNAAYQGSSIKTAVDNASVTLTGTVNSSMQHEMALQIARAYAENRKIVDKLVIQP
jgi:osmotically-inducible protein OsmY